MKPYGRRLSGMALPVLFALAVPCANAGVLYGTGFESPAFSPGGIAGQDGWNVFGPGPNAVEGAFAKTGSQAVFVGGSTSSQSGPYHSDSSTGPFVRLSADLAVFTSSTQSEWQFGGLGPGLVGFLGGINILPDSSIQAISGAFPTIGTFARATAFDSTAWHHVELLFNMQAQTYDVTIDGSNIASGLAFCSSNGACTGAPMASYGSAIFDSFGLGGDANDSGYMDNFEVAEFANAPEPSSILLIAGGLGAMLVRLRRKAS